MTSDYVRYLTDEALAERLLRVAHNVRSFTVAERNDLLTEAARRLNVHAAIQREAALSE